LCPFADYYNHADEGVGSVPLVCEVGYAERWVV